MKGNTLQNFPAINYVKQLNITLERCILFAMKQTDKKFDTEGSGKLKEIHIKIRISILAILLVILAFIILKRSSVFKKSEPNIITSSILEDAVNISNLSTAQFTYNGIAEIYEDEDQKEVKCHILYNAKVKAGIDMKDVTFDIDKEKKTIKPTLPEINITSNTVDEKSLSYIPDHTKIDLKEALIACQDDALSEAQKSSQLIASAENNLKSIIEALLLPIANAQAYTIVWDK